MQIDTGLFFKALGCVLVHADKDEQKRGEGAYEAASSRIERFCRKAIALNLVDAAKFVAVMDDASTLGQDVERPLFKFGNIHVRDPDAVIKCTKRPGINECLSIYVLADN